MDTIQLLDRFDRELPLFALKYKGIRAYIYFCTEAGQPKWLLKMWDGKGAESEKVFPTLGYAILAAKEWIQHYYEDAIVRIKF